MENEKCRLETLPAELQAMIMVRSSSSQSLFNLIRASPVFYHQFSTSRELFLSDFLRHLLPAKILSTAQAAVSATMLEKGQRNRKNHLDIIKTYLAEREAAFPATELIDLSTSIRICRFNNSVERFIQDFVERSSRFLAPHGYSLGIDNFPVTQTEQWRLQRAFYHFQLHACLNNEDESGVSGLSPLEQADHFRLPEFEIEELSCVLSYIAGRLDETYERFEETFVRSLLSEMDKPEHAHKDPRTKAKHAINKLLGGGGLELCDRFFGKFNKYYHSRFQQQQMSYGLVYLGQLFEAENTKQYEVVLTENWKALRSPYRGLMFALLPRIRREDGMDWLRGDGQLSGRDDIQVQSEGFLWANGDFHAHRTRYDSNLERWGYVFWDGERLRSSGIIRIR
ncbi:hypothetical protein MMC31_002403 [Peltigera leucophlebia]|nr:hypothetical protein [Peltigera leucophlebia]